MERNPESYCYVFAPNEGSKSDGQARRTPEIALDNEALHIAKRSPFPRHLNGLSALTDSEYSARVVGSC